MTTTRKALPMQMRRATLQSVDPEARTAQLVWSTGAPVERTDFWTGERYVEELSLDPAHVDLSRLNAGAPLLNTHNRYDLGDVIGVVENAYVKNGEGISTVRFARSEDDESAGRIFAKVRDGIIRNVSVGYSVRKYEITERAGQPTVWRAIDWQPMEISLVPVGADAAAGVRAEGSEQGRTYPCELIRSAPAGIRKEHLMEDTTQAAPVQTAEPQTREPDTAHVQQAVQQAVAAERRRVSEIRSLARDYAQFNVSDICERAEADPAVSHDAVRLQILEHIRATRVQKPLDPRPAESQQRQYGDGVLHFRYRKLNPVWGSGAEGEQRAYRAGMWARAAILGDARAAVWCRDQGIDMTVRAMGENTNSTGGFLVPIEMEQAVIDLRDEYGIAGRLARIRPMGSDQRNIPKKTGRPSAYFTDFDTAWTESDQAWGNVLLSAKRLACATRVDTDLIEDAVIDVANDIAEDFAWAFAKKEDECLLVGDGTSTYAGIVGFNPKFEGTAYASRITTTSGHDTFPEIDATDLATVLAGPAEFGKRGAVWVCSQEFKSTVFDRLASAAGGNTMAMLGGMPAEAYLGYPIVTSPAMPAGVTTDYTSKVMALFGNFTMASSMGRRRGITVQVLRERYADKGQIGIIASERIDLVVHDLGDTTNKGPVAALYGNS